MVKKVDMAVAAALARVELCKQRIVALHFAMGGVRDKMTKEVERDFSALHAALYRELNYAYQSVFMWGTIIGGETAKQAKRMAYKDFLNERTSIMQLLDTDGRYPWQWDGSEEEAFRKELEAMKGEKACGG